MASVPAGRGADIQSLTTIDDAGERVVEVGRLDPAAAVAMLRDRAHTVGRGLQKDARTEEALHELARRLDHLPLALELAAARLAVLSPRQLAERLDRPLELLSHGLRDAGRHQSLREAIAVSWDLLSGEQQQALAACSVFRGGFWLDEAEAVLDGPVIDTIQGLVERSLVHASDVAEVPGEVRFSLLLAVRAFAAEALAASGAAAEVVARHAEAYAALGNRLRGRSRRTSARRRLRLEADNLRAVTERATDPALACRAALALDPVLEHTASLADRRRLAERAIALARQVGDPLLLFDALLSWSHGVRGTPTRPDDALDEALSLVASSPTQQVTALLVRGDDHLGRGEASLAREPLVRAQELVSCLDEPILAHRVLQARLHQCIDSGAFDEGQPVADALVALRRRHDLDTLPVANLAVWLSRSGREDDSDAAMTVDLALHRRHGDRHQEVRRPAARASIGLCTVDRRFSCVWFPQRLW